MGGGEGSRWDTSNSFCHFWKVKITCLFHESMESSRRHSILLRQPISDLCCQFPLEHDSFSSKRLSLPPAVLHSIMSEENLKEASAPMGSEKSNAEPDCLGQGQHHHRLTLKKSLTPAGPRGTHLKMEVLILSQRIVGRITLVDMCTKRRAILLRKNCV